MGRYIESGPYFDRAEELDPDYAVPLTARFPFNLFVNSKNGGVKGCFRKGPAGDIVLPSFLLCYLRSDSSQDR
jgi:hypothetical protein